MNLNFDLLKVVNFKLCLISSDKRSFGGVRAALPSTFSPPLFPASIESKANQIVKICCDNYVHAANFCQLPQMK